MLGTLRFFPPPASKQSGEIYNLVLLTVLPKVRRGARSLTAAPRQSICLIPICWSKMDMKLK